MKKKHEKHMLRCIEQEVCNISYMHLNQKIIFNEWSMKIDAPMRITANFESMNALLESAKENDSMEKLFVDKLVAIGYIIVKNPDYDIFSLGKEGYNKNFGEDCVEVFIYETLEIETHMKNYFKNEINKS